MVEPVPALAGVAAAPVKAPKGLRFAEDIITRPSYLRLEARTRRRKRRPARKAPKTAYALRKPAAVRICMKQTTKSSRKAPQRTCVACRQVKNKRELDTYRAHA